MPSSSFYYHCLWDFIGNNCLCKSVNFFIAVIWNWVQAKVRITWKTFLKVLYNKQVIFQRNYHSTQRLAVICPFTPVTQSFWWIKEINMHFPLRMTVIHHDVTMCDNVCFYSDWWFWEDFKEEKLLPSDIIGDQRY